MPYCPHCGAKVDYCPACGEALNAGTQAVAAQPITPEPVSLGERVLWEGKPHIKAGIKSQTTTYQVTTERVKVIHTGLAHKVEEIELTRFHDVKVDQSLAQRALKVGNVTIISTDASAPVIAFEEVTDPEMVKELIRKTALEEMERRGVRRLTQV